jgi:cytochrome c oxidase subunit 1
LAAGIFMFLFEMIRALRKGTPAEANPWGGTTLEWTIPSPPPLENFHEIPTVTRGPYDHTGRVFA